jgi:uncharacterized glyoxalase superfamily protein PhnB
MYEGATLQAQLFVADLPKSVATRGGDASAPALQPWGAVLFTATDPNGVRWNFIEGSRA